MKPARKSVSLFAFVNDAEAFVRDNFYDRPKAWLIAAREKMRDLPKTNFDLGVYFADRGKWHDALFRFRVTLYFEPDYPMALYNFGYCLYQLGHYQRAGEIFKKVLRKTPDHRDAAFLLASIDPEALHPSQRPQQMPRDMILNFFSGLAANYNQIEAENQYRGGTIVAEAVRPHMPPPPIRVIDLGCGSGIASIPYRGMANEIIGVDMTPALVIQAQSEVIGGRKLFDYVIEGDIMSLGGSLAAESADLMLMVNVAQFVGVLNNTFASVSRSLVPGGLFAITVEPFNQPAGFGIVATSGRFGHGEDYVKQLATTVGLDFIAANAVSLYPDTRAQLLLFRKGIR